MHSRLFCTNLIKIILMSVKSDGKNMSTSLSTSANFRSEAAWDSLSLSIVTTSHTSNEFWIRAGLLVCVQALIYNEFLLWWWVEFFKVSNLHAVSSSNKHLSINWFFMFRLNKDFLSKETFIFFVISVTLLTITSLEFTKQILVSVFPISPTIIILNFYLGFLY